MDWLVITVHGVYLCKRKAVFLGQSSVILCDYDASHFSSPFCVAQSQGLFTGDEHCLHKGCAAFRPAGREIVRDSYLEAAFRSSSGSRGYSELIAQRQAFQSAASRRVTSGHVAALSLAFFKTRKGTLKCEMQFLCPQDTSIIDDSRVGSARGILLFN